MTIIPIFLDTVGDFSGSDALVADEMLVTIEQLEDVFGGDCSEIEGEGWWVSTLALLDGSLELTIFVVFWILWSCVFQVASLPGLLMKPDLLRHHDLECHFGPAFYCQVC